MSAENSQLSTINSQLPDGYKQTDVGIIPEDWKVSTVGREFEIKLGKMLDAEKNFGMLKPYLGNKSVQWNRIEIDDLQMMAMTQADLKRFRLRHGDLLVCEGGEVGRAAIWESPIEECYYQKALHRLRPLRGYNTKLLLELLHYWTGRDLLANYVSQTSIAHLTREKFAEVPLPVPPLPEQQAIAEVLSDVDALVISLDRLIAKKRNLKQSAMQLLLTGKKRLAGFTDGWEEKKLGDIFDFKNGLNKEKKYFGAGTPIVNYMDVYTKKGLAAKDLQGRVSVTNSELKTYNVRKDDVFFTRTSETVEEIGIASVITEHLENTVFSGFILRARPKNNLLDTFYKKYCFSSQAVRKEITSKSSYTTRALTNGRLLSEVKISLPSLPEQKAIARMLSDMDAEIEALEKRREKYKAIKQGMMQELLTGKTRLIDNG